MSRLRRNLSTACVMHAVLITASGSFAKSPERRSINATANFDVIKIEFGVEYIIALPNNSNIIIGVREGSIRMIRDATAVLDGDGKNTALLSDQCIAKDIALRVTSRGLPARSLVEHAIAVRSCDQDAIVTYWRKGTVGSAP